MRRYQSLRGQYEFTRVLRHGAAARALPFTVAAWRPSAHGSSASPVPARVGITVTKKVGGAVVRNRLRRRCKAILDETEVLRAGTWLVIICKPEAAQLTYNQLREELQKTLAASMQRLQRTHQPARMKS